MPRLQLESDTDTLDLDEFLANGRGVQVRSGVTGLGLPPKQVQWLEGAGDGAVARGRRALPRDMDLPLMVYGRNRAELKDWLSRLAKVLAGTCTLRLVEDDDTSWYTKTEHVGGGGYTYGVDTTGEDEFFTVVTLRAGDPYFSSSVPGQKSIDARSANRGLLNNLSKLSVASSQAIGTMDIDNVGDAVAYPVWTIYGPGENFMAVSPSGEALNWTGTLAAGAVLTVDTKAGTVVDHTGANRYAELAPAPRFWSLPPGKSQAIASLDAVVADQSRVVCTWTPRKWMVI